MIVSTSNKTTKIQTFQPLNFVFLPFYFFHYFTFHIKMNFVFLPQLVGFTSFIACLTAKQLLYTLA